MRELCSSPNKQQNLSALAMGSFGFRVKGRKKELRNNAIKARHISRVSLNGGLVERPLCEVVKLRPGLPQRTQDVRAGTVL